MPNQPLTLLQNPKLTEYHQNRVSFRLVYRIQRFIYIHYLQQTQFEPMWLQVLPLSKVPALSSVQGLQHFATHRQFCAILSPLICPNQRHNELPSAESYAGAITINPFLSWGLEFFMCVEIFRCVLFNSRCVGLNQPPILASIAYLDTCANIQELGARRIHLIRSTWCFFDHNEELTLAIQILTTDMSSGHFPGMPQDCILLY